MKWFTRKKPITSTKEEELKQLLDRFLAMIPDDTVKPTLIVSDEEFKLLFPKKNPNLITDVGYYQLERDVTRNTPFFYIYTKFQWNTKKMIEVEVDRRVQVELNYHNLIKRSYEDNNKEKQ